MSGRGLDQHRASVGARRKKLERACVELVAHVEHVGDDKHAPAILSAFLTLIRPLLPPKRRGRE